MVTTNTIVLSKEDFEGELFDKVQQQLGLLLRSNNIVVTYPINNGKSVVIEFLPFNDNFAKPFWLSKLDDIESLSDEAGEKLLQELKDKYGDNDA